jgi:pimeloyl-ACP methyl ester carboxylesterase
MAALQAHLAGAYGTDEDLARFYARESRVFAPVAMDTAEVDAVLMRAGTNADALRHFNDHVAGGMNLAPGLARLQAPTLVIVGDVDPMGAPAARELVAALPNGRLEIVPGDHFPSSNESTARSGRGRCSGFWERRVWASDL